MSKQAMNQLLGSLEELGYLRRADSPDEGRSRVVRLTRRGKAAFNRIYRILQELEAEWSATLGAAQFAQLKEILMRIWESPLVQGTNIRSVAEPRVF
jgi:DNA-binding MarR family transcriptional regulator